LRFAVLGAGSIGAFIGARLADAGHDVTLVARGANLEALRANGVRVREADGGELIARPVCTDRVDAIGDADFVLVTVKAHRLPGVAPDLDAAARPDAGLAFAQNGLPWWYSIPRAPRLESLDPGGLIASHIGPGRAIGCVVYISASLAAPGVVEHGEGTRVTLGEPDGSRSEGVEALAGALSGAGLRVGVTSRILHEVWVKLLGNATLNPVSVLTRATVGGMLRGPGGRELIRGLMEEVLAVARASGVEVRISLDRRLDGAAAVGAHRTSMLQDWEAGRDLEIDALLGAVVELGERLEVPLPRLRTVLGCVRLLTGERGPRAG
jgi:2-dehydropantoate 2-reductase